MNKHFNPVTIRNVSRSNFFWLRWDVFSHCGTLFVQDEMKGTFWHESTNTGSEKIIAGSSRCHAEKVQNFAVHKAD
ncbi:hypothetical protein EMIT013CA1_130045 [Bacillus sp. IT-13CA1]